MSEEFVFLDILDCIVMVILNDLVWCNLIIGNEMIVVMLDMFVCVQVDFEVSVMILIGVDLVFCVGGDIKEMNDFDSVFCKELLVVVQSYVDGVQCLFQVIYNFDILIIVVVNGFVVGVGCDLIMMCDMCIVLEKVKFGEVFLNFGIILGDVGSWFLLCCFGYQKVVDFMYLGCLVEVEEVLEIGMVFEVVFYDKFMEWVCECVVVIVVKLLCVVCVIKWLMCNVERMDLLDFLNLVVVYQVLMYQIEDYYEVIVVFIEK